MSSLMMMVVLMRMNMLYSYAYVKANGGADFVQCMARVSQRAVNEANQAEPRFAAIACICWLCLSLSPP